LALKIAQKEVETEIIAMKKKNIVMVERDKLSILKLNRATKNQIQALSNSKKTMQEKIFQIKKCFLGSQKAQSK